MAMPRIEVEPGWRDEQRETLPEALARVTPGCPCEVCAGWDRCASTGYECRAFRVWVKTGTAPRGQRD